jgi:hypothetical protein
VEVGLFKGFSVGSGSVVVSHLQYADDTLCIGEASVENLWTLKAILRGFEMASGLKINFWKSCLLGVNVSAEFLEMGCTFLNCKRGAVPFKYLGLPVGANPKRVDTWDPLLDQIRRRLNSWENKFISFGGRIVLLNSILNSIPIFYMSFMKMPTQVWKKLVSIQRAFLWGGLRSGKKISWVKWEVVCQEKCKGGLGVKDVRIMNLSLLAKWRWRIIQNEQSLWREVLEARYGFQISFKSDWSNIHFPAKSSNWWKDLVGLQSVDSLINWISEALEKKVGNGSSTRFWEEKWIGDTVLKEKFPRLFSLSEQKELAVSELLEAFLDRSKLLWRRSLFQWEEELVDKLGMMVSEVALSTDRDKWVWNLDEDGIFSVKSTYNYLAAELSNSEMVSMEEARVFKKIWESTAPSKIIAFSWQLLYDRLPSKRNLRSRGMVQFLHNENCTWCGVCPETGIHLLLHCNYAQEVWGRVCRWLGLDVVIPPNFFIFLLCFLDGAGSKKVRKGLLLIWHTTLWLLWKARNGLIFNNVSKSPKEVFDEVTVTTWKWGVHRLSLSPCLLYEWQQQPRFCLTK